MVFFNEHVTAATQADDCGKAAVGPSGAPRVERGTNTALGTSKWGVPKIGVSQNGWVYHGHPYWKWIIWGYHHLRKHPNAQTELVGFSSLLCTVNYDSRIFQAHGYDELSHRGLFCSSVGGLSGVRFWWKPFLKVMYIILYIPCLFLKKFEKKNATSLDQNGKTPKNPVDNIVQYSIVMC